MAKAPKLPNPSGRVFTAQEASDIIDSLSDKSEQNDPFFDEDGGEETEGTGGSEENIPDLPTRPANIADTPRVPEGSNLAGEQEQFFKEIEALGRDHGKGITSLITLAEKMVYAGATGIVDIKQVKDVYTRWRASSNTAAGKFNMEIGAEDHTITSNTSKLRAFYKVGNHFKEAGWTKMLRLARDIHVQILRNKDERKLLKTSLVPTYEALVKVASEQMRTEKDGQEVAHAVHPDLLTTDEIRKLFIPDNAQTNDPTVLDVIEVAAKAIERVIRGKVDEDTQTVIRPPFHQKMDQEGTVDSALKNSLEWILNAGEIYEKGFIAKREAIAEAARKTAEERHNKAEERKAAEAKEKAARAAERARKAAEKAMEKAVAKEKVPV